MSGRMRILAILSTALIAAQASAQDVNCSDPVTQYEMSACASIDYESADAELNVVYQQAREQMHE